MKRALSALSLITIVYLVPAVVDAVTPPRDGGAMPRWYHERIERDPSAFQFQNAWIKKVERIREARERYVEERGFYYKQLIAPGQREQFSVTGTIRVPVFCSEFSNVSAPAATPVAGLAGKLFDGPGSPLTLTEYYAEVSYGDIIVTGDVYGWHTLSNTDVYYEGPSGCNGLCGSDQLDEYVTETLVANDGAVDFSLYDNDGPDNIPNSGDDDGFVDFIAFVHPEVGAECGGTPINIWSHRWNLNSLLGAPWVTNDARAGGGFIRINDYVMQPALNCDGVTMIDIGVFAHEFGHALSLADLYDTNGGSAGIGHWGLMGSGGWNTPDRPAHLSPWSKSQLGWSNVINVGTKKASYVLPNAEFNREIYRLDVTHQRWRRMSTCAINGSYSLRCGLLAPEGNARNWAAGDGYGDGWIETTRRDFSYNGTDHPVSLSYVYDYESEPSYDFINVRIDVGGTISTLATYDGVGSGTANIDLTPYLDGSGVGAYSISFAFTSDVAWSDRDGSYTTTCGPLVLDDIAVSGGGEAYSTDFETRRDGWYTDMDTPAEYFLVENRQPVGSDLSLWGGGGICIWHINEDVARTGQGGNTGGGNGLLVHGINLEQADGADNLGANTNRGDPGDPFPGSTANTSFNTGSAPSSLSDDGLATLVCVANISANPANGGSMTADMAGGWPLPTLTAAVSPDTLPNDTTAVITINGTGLVKGVTVELIKTTFAANAMTGPVPASTITASSVEWVDHDLILATFDLNGAVGGSYDVVVTNPGDGCVVDAKGFTVGYEITTDTSEPASFSSTLRQNYPNPFNPTTTIPFELEKRAHTTLRIYNVAGQVVRTLLDAQLDANGYAIKWNGTNDAGTVVPSGVYFYKLVSGNFQEVRKLVLLK